jgi:hypothetical protein
MSNGTPSVPQKVAYEVPEAFQEAPRLQGIPAVPSASALWDSPAVKLVSVWILLVSILEMVACTPFILAMFGLLSLAAAILGIIAASFHLCDSCGSQVIDSNLGLVRLPIQQLVSQCLVPSSLYYTLIIENVASAERRGHNKVLATLKQYVNLEESSS